MLIIKMILFLLNFSLFILLKKVIIFLLKKMTFLCQSLNRKWKNKFIYKEFNIENDVTLETSYFEVLKIIMIINISMLILLKKLEEIFVLEYYILIKLINLELKI